MSEEKNLTSLWQKVLKETDGILPKEAIKQWILRIVPISLENNELVLAVADEFTKQYIEPRYLVLLGDAVHQALGAKYKITLIVAPVASEEKDNAEIEPAAPASLKEPAEETAPAQGSLPLTPPETHAAAPDDTTTLNPKYTFEAFVTGRSNQFPYAMAKAVADAPGLPSHNPLFIYGGVGLGKTHLMHAIGNFILQDSPSKKVLYVTSEDFLNEVIESIRNNSSGSMSRFRDKYRTVDILLIDDIQFIIGKESTQEEFFHTFNALHSAGKQIVLTSDRPPKEMETLDTRIRSRFEWGLMADVGSPDYETRMAILRRRCEMDRFSLPDEILDYIASNIKSNIRELEGALNKLIAYSNLEKTTITMEIASRELQNIISPDTPREITPQLIIEMVSEHYQISVDQMISKNRSSAVAKPRQIAMYLCKDMTSSPLEAIGSLLGGRDHSTIIHGANKIADEYNSDEELHKQIDAIRKKLNPS